MQAASDVLVDLLRVSDHDQSAEEILEFADVTGPRVCREQLDRFRRELDLAPVLRVEAGEMVRHESR